MATSSEKRIHGISLKLTDEQKKAIQQFWKDHGSVGTLGLEIEVVNDRIAPASIQVGTAK